MVMSIVLTVNRCSQMLWAQMLWAQFISSPVWLAVSRRPASGLRERATIKIKVKVVKGELLCIEPQRTVIKPKSVRRGLLWGGW